MEHESRQHEHWYWWGAALVAVGAVFILLAPSGKDAAGHPVDRWLQWEAFAAYGMFALAIFCGFAGAGGWRFPLMSRRSTFVRSWHEPKSMSPETQPSTIGSAIVSSVVAGREELAERIRHQPELERVSRLIGMELRRMRVMIEETKETVPMVYAPGFRLPVERWSEEVGDVLAHYRDRYAPVERAYDAAKRLNGLIRAREERQWAEGGALYSLSPKPIPVRETDGFNEVHGLAGEALDALGERHNDPFQAKPREDNPAGQKRQRAKERRKETLLRFADRGEDYRERITRAVYPSPPSIVGGGEVSWMVSRILVIKWLSELADYARVELSEDFVRRIPTVGDPTPRATLAAIDAAIALIEETVEAAP